MSADDVYSLLSERLGAPDSPLLTAVLSRLVTPEESRFLLALPASPAELAARLHQDEATIEHTQAVLLHKGFLVQAPEGLRLPRDPGTLRDQVLGSRPAWFPEDVPQLFKTFFFKDYFLRVTNPAEGMETMDTSWTKPVMRVLPAQRSVAEVADLLPLETVRGIIDAHVGPISLVNCACRVMNRNCEAPAGVCMHFGERAEFDLRRGIATELSPEEAMAKSLEAEEAGLVITTGNTSAREALSFLCHCCGCDCLAMYGPMQVGTLLNIVSPSRFLAVVDPQACNGCQDCVERCDFNAIEMAKASGSKKLKATVDRDKCMGCGQCTIDCLPVAIQMQQVRAPEHIPSEYFYCP